MTWTKKHDEFALVCKFRPSTRLLASWVLRRAKPNEVTEIEIDLRVFNSWIAKKRGTPYDRKTIREAIAQLDQSSRGLVLITKQYSPWVMKLVVRPLSLVASENPRKKDSIPKILDGNPMYDEDHKKASYIQQQQDISKIETFLSNLGMNYTPDAILKLWRMAGKSVTEVKNAVELMLFQNSTQSEPIKKPHGWLYDCLRFGWQKGMNLYYQLDLPLFSSVQDLEGFVDKLLPDKPNQCQT